MAKLKRRADGRYAKQIYLGRDEDGKRVYKTVYGRTASEAMEKELAVRMDMGHGLDILSQSDDFATWADDWLRTKMAAQITDKQKANYQRGVKFWKEALAGYKIGQVTADMIEFQLVSMQEAEYAMRTVNFYRSTIRQILQRAVGRALTSNPVDLIQLTQPGKKAEKRRALEAHEQQWLWETPHRAQPAAIICMLSGLRRGELAALTWGDVNLDRRTITVDKTVEYPPGEPPRLRHLTKSVSGMRTVDIPQKLADYMRAMDHSNPLVIPSAHGKIMSESAWISLWGSYMRVLNIKYGTRTPADLERMKTPGQHKFDMTIPPITLHWLRHTFCTLLYLAGVDVAQACAQMGHADVSTTLKIYTHLDAIHKRKSVDKLDAYLGRRDGSEDD